MDYYDKTFTEVFVMGLFTSLIFLFIEARKRRWNSKYRINYYWALSGCLFYPVGHYSVYYLTVYREYLIENVDLTTHILMAVGVAFTGVLLFCLRYFIQLYWLNHKTEITHISFPVKLLRLCFGPIIMGYLLFCLIMFGTENWNVWIGFAGIMTVFVCVDGVLLKVEGK